MSEFFSNPKHWRDRAQKTRVAAAGFFVSKSEKKRLLKIAAEYDQLAERAEQWRAGLDPQQQATP